MHFAAEPDLGKLVTQAYDSARRNPATIPPAVLERYVNTLHALADEFGWGPAGLYSHALEELNREFPPIKEVVAPATTAPAPGVPAPLVTPVAVPANTGVVPPRPLSPTLTGESIWNEEYAKRKLAVAVPEVDRQTKIKYANALLATGESEASVRAQVNGWLDAFVALPSYRVVASAQDTQKKAFFWALGLGAVAAGIYFWRK